MHADPLEIFWLCGHTNKPVLTYDQFRMIPDDIRKTLLDTGLLKEGQPSRSVECDGCEDGGKDDPLAQGRASYPREGEEDIEMRCVFYMSFSDFVYACAFAPVLY